VKKSQNLNLQEDCMSYGTRFGKLFLFPVVTFMTVLALAITAPAQTAPGSIFELDGNSTEDGHLPAPDCDWNPLNDSFTTNQTSPGTPCVPFGTSANGFGFLVGAPGEPSFTTGGSKDSSDISQWQWSVGSTPDKDTLTHGYGAGYAVSGGEKILIFGAERFAVNGDSNIGIWFFQQNIGLTPPPPASKGGFTGLHTPGDILIVSAFTAGGGASTISVYQWAPAGSAAVLGHVDCPNSNYPNISTSGAVNVCAAQNLFALFFDVSAASSSTGVAFAIVNPSPTTIGWPYESKFGVVGSNVVSQGGFYEGGINLTALIGGATAPCFASFLFETRSSQSTNAVLKDFLVGSFPQCHVSVSKTYNCNSFNADNTFNYSYTGTVTNDGGGDLFNVQVTDTPVGSTTPVTYNCGNLPRGTGAPPSLQFPGPSCPQPSGTTNTFTTANHPASNVATVSVCTSALAGGTCTSTVLTATTGSVTSTDQIVNGVNQCNPVPNIDVTKRCVTAFQAVGSNVVVRVDFTGEVTNNGQLNLNNVNVTDDAGGGPFSVGSLNPGQSRCYTNGQPVDPTANPPTGCPTLSVTTGLTNGTPTGAASYFPTSANVFGLTAGRIQFTDTVTATGTASNGASVGPKTASAMCVICPFGSCATQ